MLHRAAAADDARHLLSAGRRGPDCCLHCDRPSRSAQRRVGAAAAGGRAVTLRCTLFRVFYSKF